MKLSATELWSTFLQDVRPVQTRQSAEPPQPDRGSRLQRARATKSPWALGAQEVV